MIQKRTSILLIVLFAVVPLVCLPYDTVCRAESPSSTDQSSHQRITEKKNDSTAKKIAMIPVRAVILPFWLAGKGIEAGLLGVEENNLIAKSYYYRQKLRQRGISVEFGVGHDGAGFGAGIDWTVFGGPVSPTISAAGSVRLYQVYGLRFDFSRALAQKMGASVDIQYKSLPQEDYYGIGRYTRLEDRTNYDREQIDVGLYLNKSFAKLVRLGAGIGYDNSNIFKGEDERFPSTEEVFDPTVAPGLETGARLLSGTLTLELTTLDYLDDPTSGILLRAMGGIYEDLDNGRFDFSKYSLEFQGYVPLLGRGNRFGPRSLIGVRVVADFREPRHGGEIPFFHLPHIGGSSMLRGFREFRFNDRNAVVTNVEYRFPIQHLIQAVIFWDEGQVFECARDFDFSHFRSSFGGGLRFVVRHDAFARLEVGTGSEETRVYFKFGKVY